ncbi:C39 family peptidase [Saccharomonospora azurea]|uniref:C39 family peptidase n=1 Tax=Saccharomonospora azurea TaxID=40988 RepID=UPI003D8D12C0
MDIDYHEWSGEAQFGHGESSGTEVGNAGLRIGTAAGVQDGAEYAWWTSPEHDVPFDADELVVSWNAVTPPGTWLTVEVEAHTDSGQRTPWFSMGRWSFDETDVRSTSVPGQRDETAHVAVDRLVAADGVRLRGYRLRVTLCRAGGTDAGPVLSAVGAVASAVEPRTEVATSPPGPGLGIELPVPRYAQYLHRGHFAEYGGGGDGWCSPASTEMVVEYWGVGPTEAQLAWIPHDHPDRSVVHAARHTFDHAYGGTGNWAFNVAYASQYGLRGRVTRLASLRDVEQHVAHGVPVIVSVSFIEGELPGADYATKGHLLVVVGFTGTGDVIAHDPAAEDAASVRRVYPRAAFETVWQRTRRTEEDGAVVDTPAGIAYLIAPPGASLR